MKKVLITGGVGFIGSWLSRMLLERGTEVVCLDNLLYGDMGLKDLLGLPGFTFMQGDICNIRDLALALQSCDGVVALAAIVGDPACNLDEDQTHLVNYESTKLLASMCKFRSIKRVIFTSSCSVYGAGDDIILNEGSKLRPVSQYARTRILSERVLLAEDSINPVILRLSTVYGYSHRMRFDLVLNFFAAQASAKNEIRVFGGSQFRPMIHVRDVARAIISVLEASSDIVDGEIFNVGSNSQNFTISQLAEIVRGVEPDLRIRYETESSDNRNYRVSFDKIEHLLKFNTIHTPAQAVEEMIAEILNKPIDWENPIHYNVKYLFKA